MLRVARNCLLILTFLMMSPWGHAVIIEAEGQARIINENIKAARENAIRDASQQAAMQAAVYVSSSQVVRDGILEIDNMQISTLGKVSNIEILDEKVIGNHLHIRIKADVLIDEGCKNGITNTYAKSVAFSAFPLAKQQQANLGALHNIASSFPATLINQIPETGNITSLKATHISLFPNLNQTPTTQLDDGTHSNALSATGHFHVNYIVSGVIRDIGMVDPRTHAEQNYFIDLYNRLDYKSRKHLRNFAIDLFIFDGFSGQLIKKEHYQTAGLWALDPSLHTGFATAAFHKQDYGQKVLALQQKIAKDLVETLRCEPFTTSISRVEDRTIWINAGRLQDVKVGDKLTLYRKETFFTPDMKANTQLINTRQTLVIDNVQQGFASGYINSAAASFNIRPGDIAIAR